jgi:acyl-CoA thioester hydrolase
MWQGLPITYRGRIQPEWIDHNGHMNVGYYMVVFDFAVEDWLAYCGLSVEHLRDHGATTFVAESHATYEQELLEGDPIMISGQLLEFADKKIHTFFRMFHAEHRYLAATHEIMTLHIDGAIRRPGPMPPEILDRLAAVQHLQAGIPRPVQAGRSLSVHAKRPPSAP